MYYICEYHMNTEYEVHSLRLDFMELMGNFFFNFLLYIRVEPVDSVVIVSGEQ